MEAERQSSGGTLRIFAQPPAGFPKDTGFGASFRVGVPAGSGLALDAKTVNGAVRIENTNTKGDVTARSDYGEVRVANAGIGAEIDVRTTNGKVSIMNDRPVQSITAQSDYGAVTAAGQAETVDVRTTNGAVTVTGAKNARTVSARSDYGSVTVADCGGTVQAETSNGGVTLRGGTPERVTGKSDYGSVFCTLSGGAAPQAVDLTTSNGAVHLTVPHDASLRITARTSNGHIKASGVDGGNQSGDDYDRSFTGTVGGGASPVNLRTDYGSISITAR